MYPHRAWLSLSQLMHGTALNSERIYDMMMMSSMILEPDPGVLGEAQLCSVWVVQLEEGPRG